MGDLEAACLKPSQNHAPSKAREVLKNFAYKRIECIVAKVGRLRQGASKRSLNCAICHHFISENGQTWLGKAKFKGSASDSL